MSILKTIIICIAICSFCAATTDSYCQVGDAYAAAASVARTAAGKTKCPENRIYYIKIAEWCKCMAEIGKTGITTNCGPRPANAPICKADNIGGESGESPVSLENSPGPFKEILLKQQQFQRELNMAQNASMAAYEGAINTGKKGSGAILEATLAGSQQLSDPNSSLVYTGVGMGVALFAHLAEKKAEKEEKQLTAKKEEEEKRAGYWRRQLVIDTKTKFISEALNINKYNFSDLVSKDRHAAILMVPKNYEAEEQEIYFSSPVQVPKYSDDTYPLKDEIERQLLFCMDKSIAAGKIVYTLYPITDPEKFISDFVKKMGSGKVILLNAKLLSLLKQPFAKSETLDGGETDFWGNRIIKEEKNQTSPDKKPANKNFWNQ